jgi:hypothetical protein
MNNEQISTAATKIENLAVRAEQGDQAAQKLLTDAFKSVTGPDLLDIYRQVNKDSHGLIGTFAKIDVDKYGTPIAISFHPSVLQRTGGALNDKPPHSIQVKLINQNYCLADPCL